MRAKLNRAFTLVEILIVVVILGILAAVVIPQFVNASDEAQVGNVETQLRTLRTQIQLYRAQSDENIFPPLTAATTGAVAWLPMIDAQLLQAAPVNPRTNSALIELDDTATGQVGMDAALAVVDAGWLYNPDTGEIWAASFNEDYRSDDDTHGGEPWVE